MGKRRVRVESFAVCTRVPKSFLDEIENLVKKGYYMDVSDYLRYIIRRDLEGRGFPPAVIEFLGVPSDIKEGDDMNGA